MCKKMQKYLFYSEMLNLNWKNFYFYSICQKPNMVIWNINGSIVCICADWATWAAAPLNKPSIVLSGSWLSGHVTHEVCVPAAVPSHTLTSVTQAALPAVWTEALERVDAVDASASVLTGRWRTVINVCKDEARNDIYLHAESRETVFGFEVFNFPKA